MIPEYPKLIALIENDVTNITITQQEISVKCIPPSLIVCGSPFWTAGTLGKLLQTEIAGGKNTHKIQDECWTQKHRGFAFCGGPICRGRNITRWKVFDQSEIFRAIGYDTSKAYIPNPSKYDPPGKEILQKKHHQTLLSNVAGAKESKTLCMMMQERCF